ncbi:MAG: NAD-dependent epimerase/dehydratase family protein [Candidatus Kapaibacterium sp.]
MKLLILGGTHFIGRAFVEHLLEVNAGHDTTLFNRGITNAQIFPELRKITGDRETDDLNKVLSENWDCIIDINGYYPNSLKGFLPKLKGKVGRYVYVSTVSVYDPGKYLGLVNQVAEDSPLLACTEEQRGGDWSMFYGEKKAECERILIQNDWLDKIILRPSIVYGKYDYTERYYYWLQRMAKRERILIPDNGNERGNLTFVDDLARLLNSAISIPGHRITYNAVTHPVNTLREKLDAITTVSARTPEFVSISADALLEKGFKVGRAFPCVFGSDYIIYDISKTQADLCVEFTEYGNSVAAAYKYYEQTTKWELGSRGLRYKEEDELIKFISK